VAFEVGHRWRPEANFSTERFVQFLYHADVGLAILDHQLRYLILNPFLARIHGSSAESHIGKRLQDVVGGLSPQLVPAYEEVVATGRPVLDLAVKEAVSPDTVAGHWIDNLFPLKDERGKVTTVCAIVAEAPCYKKLQEAHPDLSPLTMQTVLLSWKEIAEYSGACIKTVQRWEKSHGFPVRRLKASKGAVVSALKSEVDGWMRLGMATTKGKNENEPFRSLFINSPLPTLIVSDEHLVVDANIAMTNLLGSERNDLVGRRLETICNYTSANVRGDTNMHQKALSTALRTFSCADGAVFTAECALQKLAPGMQSISLTNIHRGAPPASHSTAW
jgi:PAS domain-containing protein